MEEYSFKKSNLVTCWLAMVLAILSIINYLALTSGRETLQIVVSVLSAGVIVGLFYSKSLALVSSQRRILLKSKILFFVVRSTVEDLSKASVVEVYDDYVSRGAGTPGSTCWLNVDIKNKLGNSVLTVQAQKFLREQSKDNRATLIKAANSMAKSMGLEYRDSCSTRYAH